MLIDIAYVFQHKQNKQKKINIYLTHTGTEDDR
jgi:hypothetical protein